LPEEEKGSSHVEGSAMNPGNIREEDDMDLEMSDMMG